MAGRALLTDRQREWIKETDSQADDRYVAISEVRKRIHDELPKDLELLKNNHEELYQELLTVVDESRDE
jgi:ribosome recycling factor